VSTTLGFADGEIDGTKVGLLVLVGPAVLGTLVGCADTVGAEVGLLLGCDEGCEVGDTNVGVTEGTSEGMKVVGLTVGGCMCN
jgi:hypothetical protein